MSLSGRQRGAASRIALLGKQLLRRRNASSCSFSSFALRSNNVYALFCDDERICNDVKRGDFHYHQMPFGLGRSFAAAADASSVVARKKKTLKTGAVVGTTTNTSSSSSSSSASNNATTNSMTRRQTKKLDLNPPTIPGVFDSIEDAAWNAAVAEVERERELEDIGEEDVRYDENGNVLNNPAAAREEYRNTAAAASNSGNSPLSRFDYSLPVRAYYLGSTVDFRRLARELPTYPKEFTRECVVIRLAARRSVELASGGVGGNSSVSHLVNSGSSSSSNGNDERKLNTLASLREAAEEVLNKRKKGVLKGENGEHILEQKDMETSAEETTTATAAATTTTTSPSQRGVGIPSTDLMRYMVVFKFGSVVFYNVGAQEREECLELTRNFVESPLAYPMKEDYLVKVSPRLDEWAKLESDHIVLKRLDVNNISVISAVLAQTVALEHYEHKVDAMVEIFSKLNKSTELTGDLNISKKRLFSLVAENNNTLTELITRLGLLGRSDTAWQYAQYNIVWEGLRQDFELEDRFQDLDYKLNLIQTQVKFYLEILQNRKSDFLEWTIIVLIALEICVSLYDMSDKLPSLPF